MKTFYVYLGGSHLDEEDWRKRFNEHSTALSLDGYRIIGIDPFKRHIDETDPSAIVERDLAILHDERLTHVVLKSCGPGSLLSTGTSIECVVAGYLKKPVVVVGQPDLKKVIQSSTTETGWIHPFVKYFANVIVENVEMAVDWIADDIQCSREEKPLQDRLQDLSSSYVYNSQDIDPFRV